MIQLRFREDKKTSEGHTAINARIWIQGFFGSENSFIYFLLHRKFVVILETSNNTGKNKKTKKLTEIPSSPK